MVCCFIFATALSTAYALAVPFETSDAIFKSKPIAREIQPRVFGKRPFEEDPKPDPVEITNGSPDGHSGSMMDENQYKRIKTQTPSYDIMSPLSPGRLPPKRNENYVRLGTKETIIYRGESLHVLTYDGFVYAQTVGRTLTGEEMVSKPLLWTPYDPQHPSLYDASRQEAFDRMDPVDQRKLSDAIASRLAALRTPMTPKEAADLMNLNWHATQATSGDMDLHNVVYEDNSDDAATPRAYPQWGELPEYIPDEKDVAFAHSDLSFGPDLPTWNQIRDNLFGLRKRQTPVDEIKIQEVTGGTGRKNSSADLRAEFQLYLDAYQTAQANVSNLLFPFFDTILNTTKNSLIYDTIWSVYSDLTGIGPHITGPFSYGMHCFDWIEDQCRNSTLKSTSSMKNTNATDPAMQQMLATHYILLEIYDYAWTNGKAIANQTGLLSDMIKLSEYLTPTDPSIMSAEWTSPQNNFDDSYFTDYNKTMRT